MLRSPSSRAVPAGRTTLGLLFLLAVTMTEGSAHADDVTAPATTGERRWYGWQLLALDGAALTAGLVTHSKAPVFVAYGADLLGAATIHVAHGNGAKAVASVGIRLCFTMVGVLASILSSPNCYSDCGPPVTVLLPVLGAATGALLDDVFLARTRDPSAPPTFSR